MQISDGHELRGSVDKLMLVPCTRWKELQGAVEYHATLAGLLGATTVFRLLNDPGANVGNQEFSVSGENSVLSLDEEVALAVRTIQLTEPAGVTPLTQHLNVVGERIRLLEPTLKRQGQKAVVVIATDGLPSDETGKSNESIKKEFVSALRRLQVLPVWVVVRLCTDDNSVVDYYNDLDKVLELPIECIDDFSGEAKEVSAVNKWLNYALPLHRCREMGYQHRIFDLLDERTLNKDELRELVVLLFGEAAFRNAPDAHSDWKGFCTVLEHVVKSERNEWNCNTFRLSPWIDMKQLHKTYDERCGLFGLGRKKR